MKITSLTYRKNFPVSQFIFETIGVEVMVNEGDDPQKILSEAIQWVENQHIPMEEMRGTHVRTIEPANPVDSFIEAIKTSTTQKGVEIFRKLVERENIPELTAAFEEKLKEFDGK